MEIYNLMNLINFDLITYFLALGLGPWVFDCEGCLNGNGLLKGSCCVWEREYDGGICIVIESICVFGIFLV